MKSAIVPSFWEKYRKLNHDVRLRAKKPTVYGLRIHFIPHYASNVSIIMKIFGRYELLSDAEPSGFLTKTKSLGFGLETMMNMSDFSVNRILWN